MRSCYEKFPSCLEFFSQVSWITNKVLLLVFFDRPQRSRRLLPSRMRVIRPDVDLQPGRLWQLNRGDDHRRPWARGSRPRGGQTRSFSRPATPMPVFAAGGRVGTAVGNRKIWLLPLICRWSGQHPVLRIFSLPMLLFSLPVVVEAILNILCDALLWSRSDSKQPSHNLLKN